MRPHISRQVIPGYFKMLGRIGGRKAAVLNLWWLSQHYTPGAQEAGLDLNKLTRYSDNPSGEPETYQQARRRQFAEDAQALQDKWFPAGLGKQRLLIDLWKK